MKKLAILFLLTTVLVAFTFGQVSVKGEVGLNNLGASKKAGSGTHNSEGKMNPFFALQVDAAAAKELGPGTFGLDFHVGSRVNLSTAKGDSGHVKNGDNFATFSYALAAGPGTLKPFLETDILGYLKPGAEFSGLAAGPATLGFGGFLKYTYSGTAGGSGTAQAFGTEDGGSILGIYITVKALDDKLFVKYEFDYGMGNSAGEKKAKYDKPAENDSGINRIAYIDANYKITDEFTAGIELDNTHDSFWGFQVKPYVSYKLNDHVDLGAYFALYNVLGDEDLSNSGKDIGFTPGIWAKYTF